MTDDQKSNLDLMRKLHTLPSPEKQKAMKRLGLGKSTKNDWQAALEKGGHINPGQKYWAPHSEAFKEWSES